MPSATVSGGPGAARTRARTGVVGAEAQHQVPVGPHDDGVAAHGHARKRLVRVGALVVVGARLLGRAVDGLEVVAVEVEGVAARVEVVEDNLHHLVLFQYKGVREVAVDGRVHDLVAGGEGRVERGHLGVDVGDVVEEGVVGAVAEVVHDDVEVDDAVWLGEELHFVVGLERHVVDFVVVVDEGRLWLGPRVVVRDPAGGVVVEGGRLVKEFLRPFMPVSKRLGWRGEDARAALGLGASRH